MWAAAPQGSRERILLRASAQVAGANLKLRMLKFPAAMRLFGEALGELETLSLRRAGTGGDGLVDVFPIAALSAQLKAKLAQPQLSKADWVKIGTAGRT